MLGKKVPQIQRVLNLYGIVLFLWSIYRWKLQMPAWFDEFIAKPLVFILPVYIFVAKIDGQNFFKEIWLHTKKLKRNVTLAVSLGIIFIGSALLANFVRNGELIISTILFDGSFLTAAIITFATAVSEEIFSRGFILKKFYEDSGNMYVSAFNASVLFLVIHIPILFTIPELRGSLLLLFLATDFILSLVNSFIYLDTKSLVTPILIHAFYNIAILLYI